APNRGGQRIRPDFQDLLVVRNRILQSLEVLVSPTAIQITQPIARKTFDPSCGKINGIEETSTLHVSLKEGLKNHPFIRSQAIKLVKEGSPDAPDVARSRLSQPLFQDDLIARPAQRFSQEKKLPTGRITGPAAGPSHDKMGTSVEWANRQDGL